MPNLSRPPAPTGWPEPRPHPHGHLAVTLPSATVILSVLLSHTASRILFPNHSLSDSLGGAEGKVSSSFRDSFSWVGLTFLGPAAGCHARWSRTRLCRWRGRGWILTPALAERPWASSLMLVNLSSLLTCEQPASRAATALWGSPRSTRHPRPVTCLHAPVQPARRQHTAGRGRAWRGSISTLRIPCSYSHNLDSPAALGHQPDQASKMAQEPWPGPLPEGQRGRRGPRGRKTPRPHTDQAAAHVVRDPGIHVHSQVWDALAQGPRDQKKSFNSKVSFREHFRIESILSFPLLLLITCVHTESAWRANRGCFKGLEIKVVKTGEKQRADKAHNQEIFLSPFPPTSLWALSPLIKVCRAKYWFF